MNAYVHRKISVSAALLYDRIGPELYDMVCESTGWRGPADMLYALNLAKPRYLENQPGSVFDVGVGSGTLAGIFTRAGSYVTGIDSSPAMVDHCLKNHLVAEAYVENVEEGAFPVLRPPADLTIASGLLSYLHSPENVIAGMVRSTEPGGLIAVNFHPTPHAGKTCVEGMPAESLQRNGVVDVYHHCEDRIIDAFERAGATPMLMMVNKRGLTRIDSGATLPLATLVCKRTPV